MYKDVNILLKIQLFIEMDPAFVGNQSIHPNE